MKLLLALALALLVAPLGAIAGQLRVAIEHRWGDLPLKLGVAGLKTAAGVEVSITRVAYLLSNAQLQRTDCTWIGAPDWYGFVDLEKGRTSVVLGGLPDEKFTALRFDLGLDETADKSDPATRPPGHPLHPDVNGLHWGWRGGYVFIAVEGQYRGKDGEPSGFSYHLAGQQCRGTVEIPIQLEVKGATVLRLACDVDRLFNGAHRVDVAAQNSTHSREGDPLPAKLADNAVRIFAPIGVETDQLPPSTPADTNISGTPGFPVKVPAYFPQATWPTDNPPTAAGVALGRRLFEETRLSRNGSQSCATCHHPTFAFADPRPVSIGTEGQRGTRNAMPLFNLAWKSHFFWDGRTPTLRQQVLQPIEDVNEMHETLPSVIEKLKRDDTYERDFQQAFAAATVDEKTIAKALEQYLLTLVSHDSKFDRSLRGAVELTSEEKRGFELFFTEFDPLRGQRGADCFHCHSGAVFTDHQFHNNGLDVLPSDTGREHITGEARDRGKFVTPSLRNVALTAPYMHDGRFKTLEEVVEHYDHGVQRSETLDPNIAKHPVSGMALTAEEKAALVAFLKTLSDPLFGGPPITSSR